MNATKLFSRFLLVALPVLVSSRANGQLAVHDDVPDLTGYEEVYRDTVTIDAPTVITVQKDSILEPMRVVTNKFGKNWFVFATVGAHSFRGDHSNLGNFGGTVSPEFTVGVGKWFTPGVGLKVEFDRSNSRGYTIYKTGHYGYGEGWINKDGQYVRKMKTNWWDASASVILNLSRLFRGYEGMNNKRMMNQFMLTAGIGVVHHMGYGHSNGSDNELSAHLEFQYSRFFTPAKRWSLDFKIRGIFYQSNFDMEYGQADYAAHKVDFNMGVAVGFTFYLGNKRDNGWAGSTTKLYQRDYRERDVLVVKKKETAAPSGKVEQGTMTFYVFYPNNYSGRNDAPIVADAEVNTLDYLAGGLYTQKKYADTEAATSRLLQGRQLEGMKIVDIPTEIAENISITETLPRGYEMSSTKPMSLSRRPDDMVTFEQQEGYYYAPIYDGQHTWQYRIDNETMGQQLISSANYAETETFGLNSHKGLDIVRENMKIDDGDMLVSFADVYAAINGNEGYISQFTNPETVEMIRDIINNGVISVIQTEGMATSQDNYAGTGNANQIGQERNNALAENRAESVLKWLQQNENLADALAQTFISSGKNTVNTVTDKSTRGLDAKLNRGVKVRINYLKR